LLGSGKSRNWNASDKLQIVVIAMQPGVGISEVCRRDGLNPVFCYKWKKQVLGSASRIFEDRSAKPSSQEQKREVGIQWFKNVIAEITPQDLDLRSGSRNRGSWAVAGRAPQSSA
jgi:transposase-like protein